MEIVLHNGLDKEVCDLRPDDYTTYTTTRPTTTTTYDGRPIKSRIMIYGTAPFSTTLNDPYARFQGHSMHSLTLNISETVRDTDINGILDLHRPYSTLSFRMTLSDLAKHLVSRSVARSLYDS